MQRFLNAASATAISATVFFGVISPVAAQSVELQRAKVAGVVAGELEAEERGIVEEQGPPDREGFSPSAPTIHLLATSDDKEVSLGITLSRSTVHVDPDDPLKQSAQSTRFSMHGFAPVDKDGGDRFVNLGKPMSGSRIKIGLTHYFSNYTLRQEDINEAVRIMNLSLGNCVRDRLGAWAVDKPMASRQLVTSHAEVMATLMATGKYETEQVLAIMESPSFNNLAASEAFASYQDVAAFKELSASKSGSFKDIKAVTDTCRVGTETGFKTNEPLIRRFGMGAAMNSSIRGATREAPTFFVGGDAAFGRKNFSFLDRAAFAIQDDDKGEYELSAFAGVIAGNGMWSLRAGVSHSRTYDAQDEVELCQPTATPGQTQCLSGADGAPDPSKVTALTLEGRRLFTLKGIKSQIGIAPQIAFDPDSSEYSIDVPIYFAPDKDGKLTGGIQVGYSSKKNDLSFGLFVGVPFTVFQ